MDAAADPGVADVVVERRLVALLVDPSRAAPSARLGRLGYRPMNVIDDVSRGRSSSPSGRLTSDTVGPGF